MQHELAQYSDRPESIINFIALLTFMIQKENDKIAFRMTTVASTNLAFVEECFRKFKDPAYLRSFYILLSYIFEIILKSRLVKISKNNFSDKKKLRIYLQKLSHDLQAIGNKLKNCQLKMMGIKNISVTKDRFNKNVRYKITMHRGSFLIEDFIDIRYNFFLDGRKKRIVNKKLMQQLETSIKCVRDILTTTKNLK